MERTTVILPLIQNEYAIFILNMGLIPYSPERRVHIKVWQARYLPYLQLHLVAVTSEMPPEVVCSSSLPPGLGAGGEGGGGKGR